MLKGQARKRLGKKAKKGFRGFPLATIAFYGPDRSRATKLTVGIILETTRSRSSSGADSPERSTSAKIRTPRRRS